jgi:hypothetical protein
MKKIGIKLLLLKIRENYLQKYQIVLLCNEY